MLAATTRQIDNSHNSRPGKTHKPMCGYGYQFWIIPEGGFKFSGMGSQSALVFPQQDLIVAVTGDNQGNACEYEIDDAIYEELLSSLSEPIPEAPEAYAQLRERIAGLSLRVQRGEWYSPLTEQINGKRFVMDPNPMGISQLFFTFSQGEGVLSYTNAQGDCRIPFGFGENVESQFPQENYFGRRIGRCDGEKYRSFASAAWTEPHKLMLRVLLCDRYFGNMTAVFSFKENTVSLWLGKAAEWFLNEYQGFACGHTDA